MHALTRSGNPGRLPPQLVVAQLYSGVGTTVWIFDSLCRGDAVSVLAGHPARSEGGPHKGHRMYAQRIKELNEKRLKLVNDAKALLDKAAKENRDLTPEEDAQFYDLHKQGDACKAEAEDLQKKEAAAKARAERQEGVDRDLHALRQHGINRRDFPASAAGTDDPATQQQLRRSVFVQDELRNLAIAGWARHQNGLPISEDMRNAARACRINVRNSGMWLELPRNYDRVRREIRAGLSTQTGSRGGFATLPEGFIPSLEEAMLLYGPMMETSEILRTTSGERMGWPTANDTGNTGRQIGEAEAVDEATDPAFAKVFWDAYKLTSDEILVPYEFFEDEAFEFASKLGAMLGERLGRIVNTKATTGSGAGTFKGIVTAATLGKTGASATAIAADEILDLIHSVGRAYRKGAAFQMNDATALILRKLKDSEGRYLWSAGLGGGMPDTLCTHPVHINDDLATVAASAKSILFGQMQKYKIRMVNKIRLYRLVERHRENDEDAFLAFLRADGNLLDAGVAPVKYYQQAA